MGSVAVLICKRQGKNWIHKNNISIFEIWKMEAYCLINELYGRKLGVTILINPAKDEQANLD